MAAAAEAEAAIHRMRVENLVLRDAIPSSVAPLSHRRLGEVVALGQDTVVVAEGSAESGRTGRRWDCRPG
jgi:hypothetical protein